MKRASPSCSRISKIVKCFELGLTQLGDQISPSIEATRYLKHIKTE